MLSIFDKRFRCLTIMVKIWQTLLIFDKIFELWQSLLIIDNCYIGWIFAQNSILKIWNANESHFSLKRLRRLCALKQQNACKMLSIFNFFLYLRSEGHPWDLFNPNCLFAVAQFQQHSVPIVLLKGKPKTSCHCHNMVNALICGQMLLKQ